MNWRHTRHEIATNLVGRPWWVAAAGAITTTVYALAMLYAGSQGIDLGAAGHLGGAAGGFAAGFVLGTNVYDGASAGLRAGCYGIAVLALLLGITSFVVWFAASGTAFLFYSPFFALFAVCLLAPVYAFAGLIGGTIGVTVRRWFVPDHLNPEPY
ncbi:hypothetical protein [Halococcus sp. PRR34]|uniref:hypothetical protein n=1 Tax=Halococcus sp. PRR34 TaxID=3020830 RepID=UPI0023604AD4|nr:hypothetical protein [Halococcus sp. PRR34]